jgi:thiamine kinase-like enzyme
VENFAIGNMVWNAGLIGVIAFFIKHWMHNQELSSKEAREDLKKTTAETAATVRADLKEHRDHDAKRCDEIIQSINKLTEQVRVANGRTSKLETAVAVQKQHCDDMTCGRSDSGNES